MPIYKFRFLFLVIFIFNFCSIEDQSLAKWVPYDETPELKENSKNSLKRLRFKRIQSKHQDKNSFFYPFKKELLGFTKKEYERLKPLILEKSILEIQDNVQKDLLSYEKLCLFYLFRIYYFETNRDRYLNAIISLNPDVLDNARQLDKKRKKQINHPLYGIPILIKDNIDALPMSTTAGSAAFKNNIPNNDSFLVKRLKEKGALILGKVNLSEWAYYFCQNCPLGYSALGGQTLNPYGRKIFETGGSSSGSGVAVAANYSVAAIGSETSGSILSPSGKNSVVGLKPTVGSISRNGIIPISSSLDTAGPMAKSVMDTAILMNALIGFDSNDEYSYNSNPIFYQGLDTVTLDGKSFGIFEKYEKDSLMKISLDLMRKAGAKIISFKAPEIELQNFINLLDIDMKSDLPKYIKNSTNKKLSFDSIKDIVNFNKMDSLLHAPYGQENFTRLVGVNISQNQFRKTKREMMKLAKSYFMVIKNQNLDAVISIDSKDAKFAALAHFPALGIPMGYKRNGQPQNITFIAPSKKEQILLNIGAAYEKINPVRKIPDLFK